MPTERDCGRTSSKRAATTPSSAAVRLEKSLRRGGRRGGLVRRGGQSHFSPRAPKNWDSPRTEQLGQSPHRTIGTVPAPKKRDSPRHVVRRLLETARGADVRKVAQVVVDPHVVQHAAERAQRDAHAVGTAEAAVLPARLDVRFQIEKHARDAAPSQCGVELRQYARSSLKMASWPLSPWSAGTKCLSVSSSTCDSRAAGAGCR